MDFLSAFITDIVNNGIMPKSTKDIVPSERFRRIAGQSDKAGKRSISYWLRVEHDFAYGYAKDFKTGIERRFKSYNNDQNLSRADIQRIKAMLKARQAEQDAAIAARQAKTAERAKTLWAAAAISGKSPYAERKKISPISARYLGDSLMVSVVDIKSNEIVSWQTIKPCGKKRFPFGGKKQGCGHIIGQINPLEPIIICEGYATGATIHAATKQAVIVAFDAGNLLPVAKTIRDIYKKTPIIIAADNDKSQTGQKAAQALCAKVENCTWKCPDQPDTDYNDLGLEAAQAAFSGGGGNSTFDGLQPAKSIAPAVLNSDWMSNLICDHKGRIVSTSTQNTILYTLYHDTLAGVFAYDEFRQSMIVRKCPPWAEDQDFQIAEVTDNDITKLCGYLESLGLSPSHEKTFRAVNVVAHENAFNSARDYISNLKWDGKPRLETFFKSLGCEKESDEYLAFVFKKWLTAAVKRIMQPGCKFDHVLILESQNQGYYKSTALRELATFGGESYHTDGFNITDIGREYASLKLQGVIFVELSELSGFNKKDDEIIRNWITQGVDEVRLPYERTVSKFSRKFVLCATTNAYDYLKDPSGNRRYWPVTICKPIDIEMIKAEKEQLWAEAYHHWKEGLYIGPTPEENEIAEIERSKRLQTDAWEDIVMAAIEKTGLDEFRTSDVLAKMDLKTTDKNDRSMRRISAILKANGYTNDTRWDNKAQKSVRLWSK
jgi:putative DNA primase/helicase